MIPKIIHYCWFGEAKQNDVIKECIASWHKHCPDYTFILWNEETFNVQSHPFPAKMYKEKKYAFVADYVRLIALLDRGGIYLDTDMLLLKPLDSLLDTPLLLGKESEKYISCGMIGATAHHPFIEAMRAVYDTLTELKPNPVIMTELYETMVVTDATVMPPRAFYPYDAHHIRAYRGQELGSEVFGVHLWNYSWGHPLNKAFKKLGIHRVGTKAAEILGIKKILKKILKFV
jgi:mannosyltransferase OCH1-like enzyme